MCDKPLICYVEFAGIHTDGRWEQKRREYIVLMNALKECMAFT